MVLFNRLVAIVAVSVSLVVLSGCARDGNLKEAVYETIRAANNVQNPAAGTEKHNELSYREYELKRDEAMRDDDASSKPSHSPEWLIDPNR